MNAEFQRLEQARDPQAPWKRWGPCLSERQWGTVREDYSEDGNAWDYFTHEWHHMYNADVISMPDKWEYPWYAAWDLAFHVLPLTLVDTDFGKQQLDLMLRENYLHPNGQIPACEWNFGDVNPPVHPWATIFTYRLEKVRTGKGDIAWLERSFQKLLLNFTWWLNRKDRSSKNAFEGGFLGLENIGVFDRSSPLPTGGCLEQADGTAWMALFSLNMLEIAGELAMHDATYADMVLKFIQHFVAIASATIHAGGNAGMFGGNSNWRGPIWMPVNALIIRALLQYYAYYGNEFTVECPTGSGRQMNLYHIAEEISRRLTSIFLKDKSGCRPVNGGERKMQEDRHWCDYIQFCEYFHGDNGAGLGASHQTGWTGVIARAMHLFATTTAEQVLEFGKVAAIIEVDKPPERRRKGKAVRPQGSQPPPAKPEI